jgi:hypothetical protein
MVQLRLRNMYIKVIVRLFKLTSRNGGRSEVRGGHVIDSIIVLYCFGKVVRLELPPKFHFPPPIQTVSPRP